MPTRVVFKLGNLAKKIKTLGANPLYLDEEKSIDFDFGGVALSTASSAKDSDEDDLYERRYNQRG